MKKYSSLIVTAGLIASLVLITAPAFARTGKKGGVGWMHKMSGIFGTVSAINGTTITVTGKTKPNGEGTTTTYTVDATNAKVTKSGYATSSLSGIAVGDTIMVQGTVNGSSITATAIRDGVMMRKNKPQDASSTESSFETGKQNGDNQEPQNVSGSPMIQGNGEPVVGGNVSAINGTTFTVTNKSNVVYTVNAANASIMKMGTSTAVSSVAVGDNLVIQGTVNGTSVTASSIIDNGGAPATSETTDTPKHRGNFLGIIGNFFSHLFGF